MAESKHKDVHDCKHECDCFWCKVSRKEKFPTVSESTTYGIGNIEDLKGGQ